MGLWIQDVALPSDLGFCWHCVPVLVAVETGYVIGIHRTQLDFEAVLTYFACRALPRQNWPSKTSQVSSVLLLPCCAAGCVQVDPSAATEAERQVGP